MRSWLFLIRASGPLIASFVVALPLDFAWAQNDTIATPGSDENSERLETLHVFDVDDYQTGEVVTDELTGGASRIDRHTLETSANSLARIVAQETGVQFRQSGGFGSYASVNIRASSAAQTGVYLDGILLNNGGTPIIDLSTLEMLNLDSVDIYRGSSPLQLGHGSIGGAVNVNTLSSTNSPGTRIRLNADSFSETGQYLAHQQNNGRWDMLGTASIRHSDNDFRFEDNNNTPLNPRDDSVEPRHNAQARKASSLFRLSYKLNDHRRTDLSLQLSDRRLGVPDWLNQVDNDAQFNTQTGQIHLSQIIDRFAGWNTRHTAYWHLDKAHFRDEHPYISLVPLDVENTTHTLGAKTYWERPADNGALGLSLDVRNENLDSHNRLDVPDSFSADRRGILGTLHYTWFDTEDRWTVTPALRIQHNQESSDGKSTGGSSSGTRTGGQLGVAYSVSDTIRLTGNTGTYYRVPSFGELYGTSGLVMPNSTLEAEKGINADIGVAFTRAQWSIDASLFASFRDELIVTSFDSQGVGRPLNTGKARVLGLEVAVDATLTKAVTLRSNLTLQDPRNLERDSGFYNKALPGEARLSSFTRLQYQHAKTTLWYELDIQKERFYDSVENLPAADIQQQSVGLDWGRKAWQASLAIHNLEDRNVEDFNGFPKPGRHWSISVRYEM